jgi:hypothetical protein
MRTSSATLAALTIEEQVLWQEWQERVRRYRGGDIEALPKAIVGLGELRVYAWAGDTSISFPRVQRLSDLAQLPEHVRFGLAIAERTIRAHQASGAERRVYATAPTSQGLPAAELVQRLDPTRHANVLIVTPILGRYA